MSSEIITANDLKAILDEVLPVREAQVDYIVEQGTNGAWEYRKWNSGKYEAWGWFSESIAMTSVLGSTYYGNKTYSVSALGFVEIKNAQVTGNASGAYFGSKIESINTSSIQISARASSSTTATVGHWVALYGRWK